MSRRDDFEQQALPLQNDLYFAALAMCRNEADALDVVQETFYKAYRSFADFRPQAGGFKAWMFTILRNAYLDRCRAKRQQPLPLDQCDPPPQASDAMSLPLEELLDDDLLAALRSLSPRHQLLVLLADIEGLPYREIADVLGIPIGTVMSGLFNARAGLRAALATRKKS